MNTTGFRFLLTVATLGAALSQNAFADKGVFHAKVTPNEIDVNTSYSIAFTAEIGSNDLYISSVAVYETNVDGKPISNIGAMRDDGLEGDEREADTIFTLKTNIEMPEKAIRYFVITAAYKGDRMRYRSKILSVEAFGPLAVEEVKKNVALSHDIKLQFQQNLATKTVEDSLAIALQSAQQSPSVKSVTLNDFVLSIEWNSGVRTVVVLQDPSTPIDSSGNSFPMNVPDNMKNPGNDKVLIFAPGYDAEDSQSEIADRAKNLFANAEFMQFSPDPVAITKDENASLELVKHWGRYGTVIVHTHGILFKSNATDANGVALRTGTYATLEALGEYKYDLLKGRVIIGDDNYFMFLPPFILQHGDSMQNTFLYLGACDSLKDDSLWAALASKGAKVVLGWSDTVRRNFNADKFEELAAMMLPDDPSIDPKTVSQALSGMDTLDSWCPFGICVLGSGADLQLRTSSPEWQDFTFLEGGLVNGDFETGDWTGWTHGGDYNYRLISGAHRHQDGYSAALGRWDTSFHGYDETAEPSGFEWFYQDVTVPNNVTTLSFYWWMETYDTAIWDWFDAYIQDTNGNVLKNVLVQAGKPGTNYGPYWTPGGWQYVSVDISAYRGQRVRIYFDQRLDGYGDQQRVYVDDVKLQ